MIKKHGGDIYSFAKELGCSVDEVIDLSSNINFFKPNIDIDLADIDLSPYPNYQNLQIALSEAYKVEVDEIELFNGATSAISSLFCFLNLKSVTLYAPLYLEYERSARAYGYRVDKINRFEGLEKDILEGSLVVFVNPSTPDGEYYNLDTLMKYWIERDSTILIDESFLDFCGKKSAISYLKSYPKLYILKSMTKIYASAGIRVGLLLSNSKNIKNLRKREPLWKISTFDSYYLQLALRDSTFLKRSIKSNKEAKRALVDILKSSNIIKQVIPSCANFVMVELNGIGAKEFQQLLNPYKILVRDCSNFDFLDERYVRIAVKGDRALKTLKEALCMI